jgi:hypothetical protein
MVRGRKKNELKKNNDQKLTDQNPQAVPYVNTREKF